MRHRLVLSVVDLCLVGLATLCAQLLRDSFETRPEQIVVLMPYLGLTLAAAIPSLALFKLNQSIWRLSGMSDYLNVLGAAVVTVTAAVGLGFLFNRLEGVARSLPIIQAYLIVFGLVGVRVVARLRYTGRGRGIALPRSPAGPENVLIIGISPITELYLRSVAEYAAERLTVMGLLAPEESQTGRLVHRHRVLGSPEQIAAVLGELEVHGVPISRVVVTLPLGELSAEAREALQQAEEGAGVTVEFFADLICGTQPSSRLLKLDSEGSAKPSLVEQNLAKRVEVRSAQRETGFWRPSWRPSFEFQQPARPAASTVAAMPAKSLLASGVPTDRDCGDAVSGRAYWRVKRALDIAAAACAIVLLAPLLALIGVVVVAAIGPPAIFWQQRPGVGGRPFRLYKFRTMAPPYDAGGRRIADAERLSAGGRLLRRSRLDELPQLFNILIGEMSLVGPRPLLAADQVAGLDARLAVRPGMTGWAQVKGGRKLSAADKAALDVWYIRNASLWIDLQILLGTLRVVLLGERTTDREAIRQAWRELHSATGGTERSRAPVAQTVQVQPSA